MIQRSEVLAEVKSIELATAVRVLLFTLYGIVASQVRNSSCIEDDGDSNVPVFFKKDIMMVLRDRNELKEKNAVLQEKVALLKR